MNNEDLLLEIGLEEMPARFVTSSMNQLEEKLTTWLREKQISFDSVKAYSTPRRLAVLAKGVATSQPDIEEEARGPAKAIAVDDDGNWTKAALGFARGQDVSEQDLYFKETKGREYTFAHQFKKGKKTTELLPQLADLITSMVFPKSMRWNTYHLRFVRPIKWLLALYGEDVVPMTIVNVNADNKTHGHRFLGREMTVERPKQYENALLEQFVIADPLKRKEAIRSQLDSLTEEEDWHIAVDEELLEEVNNLVEYPTALFGTFNEKYLALPKDVLITTMREHQRYFPVEDKQGELLARFVTVRNGDHEHLEQVAKGNEKVLLARFGDAQFFYEEDRKKSIDNAVASLNHIVFQEDLGSTGDKVRRISELSGQIGSFLRFDGETLADIEKAADICKFDLVTYMVGEFPELQGIMGETYARLKGEKNAVAAAVKEHYMPRYKGDGLPGTNVGAVVAVADKIDTITGCFAVGLIPTGSQDPYGLRRGAAGIVQMLLEYRWNIKLEKMIADALQIYEKYGLLKRDGEEVRKEIIEFFRLRIKNHLQENGVRYDVIDAISSDGIGYVDYLADKANVMMSKIDQADFKTLVESLSRVTNIAKKAKRTDSGIDQALFQSNEEQALYHAGEQLKDQIATAAKQKDASKVYEALFTLEQPINDYFDNIMVMVGDEKLKKNRLNQMRELSRTIQSFADFHAIVL
jgi:glycyl-tRNA synthetase beta chain